MQKLKIAQSRQSFSKQAFVKSHLPEAKDLKSPGIIEVSWNNRFTIHHQ